MTIPKRVKNPGAPPEQGLISAEAAAKEPLPVGPPATLCVSRPVSAFWNAPVAQLD